MQRNGEIVLRVLQGEFPDARSDAAGGYGDMSGADGQPPVMIHRSQKIHDVLIVVKGLSGPHDDDMAQPLIALIQLLLHIHHLRDHLAAAQVTLFFRQSAGTECAAHVAADL